MVSGPAIKFVEYKIHQKPVVLFSKSSCPESKKIKKLMKTEYTHLSTKTFEAVDIERRQDVNQIEDYFMIKCLCDRRELPQLWVDGKYIGNETVIMRLHENGQLSNVLQGATREAIPHITEIQSATAREHCAQSKTVITATE